MRIVRIAGALVALLLGALSPSAWAATEFAGTLARVIDGDSFRLLFRGIQVKVDLTWIDAPELKQPYGEEAKKALRRFLRGKDIRVEETDRDRYGRITGFVFVEEESINEKMVRKGHAWVHKKNNKHKPPKLSRLETNAQAQQRGLWELPEQDRLPPWEWRETQLAARQANRVEREVPPGAVIGNSSTKTYYLPSCPGYAAVPPANRIVFGTRQQASLARFRAAPGCR